MAIGRVIGGIFLFIWRALDGLRKVLHLIVLLILFALIIAALQGSIPIVPNKTALLLNLEGRLVEQLSGDAFERAFGRATNEVAPETQMRDVIEALDAAATDKRIHVVVLDLKHLDGGGLSKLQEIGAALRKFKASGKKVVAFGETYDQAQYYLAAQADQVYLDPFGVVFVDGFEYYRMYMKGALEKLAVDLNVFKVGTYKSYTEGFTRTDMSPQEREESQAWLNVLWSAYQADLTEARGLQPGALAAYVNQAAALMKEAKGDAAQVALSQGLVTALKTRQELETELKSIVGEDKDTHDFQAVAMSNYVAAVRSEKVLERESNKAVGVVVASGEILDGHQPPGTIGGESLAKIIRDARYDDDIKAVVLRVDSPGGSMFASEQIYREVKALREAGKPVVVSMGSTAASGGYYIAAAADEIWASPTTLTGSIGVFAVVPTFQRTLQKLGVTVDGVGTTDLSGEFRLDRPLGENAKAVLQSGVEHAYDEFLQRVADNRERTPEEVNHVAQGRVWAGVDAKKHGLVDGLGNLQEAIEAAAGRAKLGSGYGVRYLDPDMTWEEALAMELRSKVRSLAATLGFEFATPSIVQKALDPLQREMKRWARFNDPRNIYSYCFCSAP